MHHIKGEPIHIQLEEPFTPYHLSAPRHVALPLLNLLKKSCNILLLKLGVIEKVDQATEWCHPIVLVRKSDNSIRICIELTKLNTVTKIEFYQLESIDETLAKLGKNCNIPTL